MTSRRKTREIRVGGVNIGGRAPVSIQSMVKVPTSRVSDAVKEIKALERAGCEIIRVAVKDSRDAESIRRIKARIRIPLVADIHFDYRLAMEAIRNGADKIRLNPGNISKRGEIREVVMLAKKRRIPIRIGVNSGSVPKGSGGLAAAAKGYIKLFEEMDFRDIIISLKGSGVVSTVEAYRELATSCDYPFHLGVTASGLPFEGAIKSAIAMGALLLDGIGDTIRVSLTGSSCEEVSVAKKILSALALRHFGPEIISCPTCGRCQVDLVKIVKECDERVQSTGCRVQRKPVRVAIMGCEVNGPGEAKEADIGIAAGKKSGVLFKKGRVLRKVAEKDFVKELLKELRQI